jgi:hypothetical protein
MDVQKIIAELREERANLDEVVLGLERMSLRQRPRRGWLPAWSKVKSLSASKSSNGLNGSIGSAKQIAHAFPPADALERAAPGRPPGIMA